MNICVIDSQNKQHLSKVSFVLEKNFQKKISYFVLESSEVSELISVLKKILHGKKSYKVIHMSVGLEYYYRELETICRELFRKGTIIVNSFSNYGGISYPAAFKTVIGVDANNIVSKDTITSSSIVNVICKQRKTKVSNETFEYGTSFLTPLITIQVIKDMEAGIEVISKYNLKDEDIILESLSSKICAKYKNKKAYAYPVGKEIKTLVENNNIFSSISIFDEKGTINKDIKFSLISECDYNVEIFVLGHCDKSAIRSSRRNKIIDECIKRNIEVYIFDENDISEDKLRNEFIVSSNETSSEYCETFGKMYYIDTPIISIFGTSSKQGKFTLQNKLNKELISRGVKVMSLSTEPHGLLCNSDDIFANGYLGINLGFDRELHIMNQKMMNLLYQEAEVITVATQSSVLPRSLDNSSFITSNIMQVVNSYNSDINILIINHNDSYDHVNNCVKFIESVTRQNVQLLVLSRVEMVEENGAESLKLIKDYNQILQSKNFDLEIQVCDCNDIDNMLQLIECAFNEVN